MHVCETPIDTGIFFRIANWYKIVAMYSVGSAFWKFGCISYR